VLCVFNAVNDECESSQVCEKLLVRFVRPIELKYIGYGLRTQGIVCKYIGLNVRVLWLYLLAIKHLA
jgi:hypothetical protein